MRFARAMADSAPMPRFLVQRSLGDAADEEVDAAAEASTRVREERFPEIEWEHTHLIRTSGGVTAFCVYAAPSAQALHDHAAAAGLPVDAIHEIERDLLS